MTTISNTAASGVNPLTAVCAQHRRLVTFNTEKIASLNRLRDEFVQFLDQDMQKNSPLFTSMLKKAVIAEGSSTASIETLEKGLSYCSEIHDKFVKFQKQIELITQACKHLNSKDILLKQAEKMNAALERVKNLDIEIIKMEASLEKMTQTQASLEKTLTEMKAQNEDFVLEAAEARKMLQQLSIQQTD